MNYINLNSKINISNGQSNKGFKKKSFNKKNENTFKNKT